MGSVMVTVHTQEGVGEEALARGMRPKFRNYLKSQDFIIFFILL